MIEELSLVHMVIIILFGLLLFFMLFIITKRQISRLTIRSARRPHINIGTGIPKSLQKEIQRRLHHVKNIKFEPTLLQKSSNDTENDMCSDSVDSNNNQKFRMKACDGFSVLEEEIVKHDIDNGERHPTETVRQYLYRLHTKGILTKVSLELIRNVVLLYENARHTPQPFEETEYNKFKENLHLIISHIRRVSAATEQTVPKRNVQVIFQGMKKGRLGGTKSMIQPRSRSNKEIESDFSQEYCRMRSNTLPSVQEKKKTPRTKSSDQTALLESRHSSQRSSSDHSTTTSTQGSVEKLIHPCHTSTTQMA
ncbi:Hypothetical predicted protein [Octopus vulgaris]|uniref:Uncharacterized protein n=2 Tax=Octopus TaxID=6643 RepID=A0AA36AT49_OCTVU|nr:protein C1orf43 homolog isoform X2 [Octopus sinensis]CAI9721229.1 Hypothetical predicted protein [Octopus vulgaris]